MRKNSVVSAAVLGSVLLVLSIMTHSAWSQTVTAAIVGTITDPAGAAVSGATVTATSVERGTTYTAETNDSGLYRISSVPVGSYTLTVDKAGFSKAVRESFVLTVNQVARIDVALSLGKQSQTVQVSGMAPMLATQTTQVDTVINAATSDEMPLAARNYVQLTLLAPGSVSTDPSSFNNGNNTAGYGGRPLINGNREQANNFMLDGMDNNQVSDNLLGYTPAPDAIEEFNLITNNAPAEFGNFEGGIVNATIKSGTNSFHGDVWEYLRNDVLNANQWSSGFNPSDILPKNKVRWNMFGFTAGGPILKNRLFFFADYQGQRFDVPSSTGFITLFTAAERNGDFSAVCSAGFDSNGICKGTGQLYNPCASFTSPCTSSSTPATTRQPFLNNQIPTTMISPVASKLFASSLYPAPINNNLQNNATNTSASKEDVDQGDLKIDYRPTQKDTISYRFTRAYQNNPTDNSFVLFSNSYGSAPILNTVGDWTRTLTNNLLNDARFGYNHITLNTGNSWASNVGQYGNTLGIGNGNPAGLDGLLGLNLSNTFVNGIGAAETTQSFDDHVWEAEDGLTWSHGRHTFKFGGQWWRDIIKTFYSGNNGELGLMDFNGQFTATNSASAGGGTGDGGADFTLGLPYQIGRGTSTGATWQQSSDIIGIYGEDTWRVTDNLTLNLGLRYDAHTPWVEANNKQANYNFATGNIDLAGQNGASRALYKGFYGGRDFQPRVGFAWTPAMLGGRTVVRGAFTISSYMEGTGTNLRLPLNPPFTPAEINASYNNVSLPLTDTTQGIVGQGVNPSCAAPQYACYAGAFLRIWDPNVQPAIANEFNLTVQHQLTHSLTAQVGYVGQTGHHLMVPYDYAQRVLRPGGATAPSPFFAKNLDLYGVLGTGNTSLPPDSGLPYGNQGAYVSGTNSNGNMSYNSLQAVLQKDMVHGLQGQVSYTYSKCMSDSTGYYGAWNNALSASAYWQNIYDQRAEWAPCYYDATHVLSAYAIYQLPFGRGQKFGGNSRKAVDEVIGGWEIAPLTSIRTGWPMPVYGAADNSGTFSRGARADCISLPSITNTTAVVGGVGVGRQWFVNNGNFVQPAAGTFGNCAPQLGGLRSPRYTDLDFSLHKNFQITERFRLQFRTDFINSLNHPQYNAPNMGLGQTMGQITSAQPPRNIQVALKIYY
ncbi:MAG: outer membrane beta-barrel protein [Acidobacteriaceae bacterium]